MQHMYSNLHHRPQPRRVNDNRETHQVQEPSSYSNIARCNENDHVQAQIRESFNATTLQLENRLAGEEADSKNAAYNAL